MSEHTEATIKTEAQIIRDSRGKPLYAVGPYNEYQVLVEADAQVTIPHEVVGLMIEKGLSPMAAWRKYRRLS